MGSFHSTIWTLINNARDGDEDALREFVLMYRPPVVAFISRRGFANEAEDLAQEVFLRVFNYHVLEKADPNKGRFRGLLATMSKHVIGNHLERTQAQKRGGGNVMSLGDIEPEAPESDAGFDREWVDHLITGAFARLALEHENYHQSLHRFLVDDESYEEIAEALDIPKSTIGNLIYRGRKKLYAYIKEDVRLYSGTRQEYNEELDFITKFFPD